MKTIIFGIAVMLCAAIHANAQVKTVPNTATSASPSVPSVEVSNVTASTKTFVSTSYKTTRNGQTDVFTETYSTGQQQGDYDDPTRAKSFTKSYAVDRGDKVNIANVYGNISVKTWDRNEVKVDADIRAYANSETEAQKLIDNVSIYTVKNGDEAVFKTTLENKQNNWGRGSRNGKRWRKEVKIYMTVYLPAHLALTATQQYGKIEMGNFSGPTLLKVQYGSIVTGNLSNANNYVAAQYSSVSLQDVNKATIKQQYGSGLTVASAGELNVSAQYANVKIGPVKGDATVKQQYGSGLSIASVDNLQLEAQYTSVKLGTVKGEANVKIQYGNGLTIEQVGDLKLSSQYASTRIGKLNGNFLATAQYGSGIFVQQVAASSRNIDINAAYVAISLAFASNYGGSLSVSTDHTGFSYGDGISARKLGDDEKSYKSKKEYSGTVGRGGASNVKVTAAYGSVAFK